MKENSTSRLSDDPTDAKERQKQEYYGGEKKAKNSPPAKACRSYSCPVAGSRQRSAKAACCH